MIPQPLENADEVLLRQVHPDQIDEISGVSKAAFIPKESDAGMLSTLRERVGPEEAHRRHTQVAKLLSAGTWGVSVAEGERQGVPAWDDACLPDNPDDHASFDFTQHPATNQRKRVARLLRDAAIARGCLFSPEDLDSAKVS